jgi:hypothetical protein
LKITAGCRRSTLRRCPRRRADSDEALLQSWLASLHSKHSRRNFKVTAQCFLVELPAGGLCTAAVEDVRERAG